MTSSVTSTDIGIEIAIRPVDLNSLKKSRRIRIARIAP